MAARRSTSEQKTPRFSRRRVSAEKKPSTALSHEALVGGVVVDDGVNHPPGRHRGLDLVEEADELLRRCAIASTGVGLSGVGGAGARHSASGGSCGWRPIAIAG